MRRRSSVLLGLAVLLCGGSTQVWALTIEEAEKLSQETGRPILAVAGRSTCGNTTAVAGSLRSPALAATVSQYVNLSIDVDKPEWDAFRQKYGDAGGSTLPFVYILRADGEKISVRSGYMTPPEVLTFVTKDAVKAGRGLTTKEFAQVEKALVAAKQADEKGDVAAGLKAFTGVRKLGVMGDKKCYAKPVVEANRLVDGWTEKGKASLKEAEDQLTSGEPTLDAAIAYVQAKSTFSQLPSLKTELTAAKAKIDQHRKLTEILRQAVALHNAQSFPATPEGRKKAAAAYARIVSAHPNTEAATRAAEAIKKLE